MTRPGEPWGEPLDPAAEVVPVGGGDAVLAARAAQHPDAIFRFGSAPRSDLARALGLGPGETRPPSMLLPCDALDLGGGALAVNAVVLGTPPDWLRWWHRAHPVTVEVDGRPVGPERATTVVIASGQFLRGANLVPRGHPGDGRIEVQVYALGAGERRGMRARLPSGEHVAHPRITQASGRRVVVEWVDGPRRFEADDRPHGTRSRVEVDVRPGVVRVLI